MGLWIRADHALVDGLEIRNVDCTGCWGLDIHGNNATIRNSRFVSNTTGILLTNGASGNLITGCLVAWNRDDGILVSSRFVTQPTTVITPAHHNTIAYSFILSNSNKGIIIQRDAHDNVVQGNLIAGNGCFGLHLRGGAQPPPTPSSRRPATRFWRTKSGATAPDARPRPVWSTIAPISPRRHPNPVGRVRQPLRRERHHRQHRHRHLQHRRLAADNRQHHCQQHVLRHLQRPRLWKHVQPCPGER